jgi:hypothetical protein
MRVLGYLFSSFNISSNDAPMVAERIRYNGVNADFLPWGQTEVLDLKCSLVPGNSDRIQVDSINLDDEKSTMIRYVVETISLKQMESKVPTNFSIQVDTRNIESRGSVTYEEVAQHLRRHMMMSFADFQRMDHRFKGRKNSDQERSAYNNIVINAMSALKRMRDVDAVPDVIVLAAQSDTNGAHTAFDFLKSARDPRATKPMCELLEENSPNFPKKHGLSNGAAEVLGKIGDPAAVPYLELGVRHGVQFAYFPLSQMGGVESMGVIINSTKDKGFDAHAHAPLFWMVMRSNLKVEPWMELNRRSEGSRNDGLMAKWRNWWVANKDEIKFVRTFEEARRAWEAQWLIDEREAKLGSKMDSWKYVIGVGIAAVLFCIYQLHMKRALTRKLMVHS